MIMLLRVGLLQVLAEYQPTQGALADYCIYLKQVSFIYLIFLIATVVVFKIPFSTQ